MLLHISGSNMLVVVVVDHTPGLPGRRKLSFLRRRKAS